MKNAFKVLMLIFLFLELSCSSLDDESTAYKSTGVWQGADTALCACCGGIVLDIDKDDRTFRIETFPEDTDLKNTDTQIKIKLDWTLNRVCQEIHYIDISKLEKY